MSESLRILILEDNPADAELVQLELEEAGFVITVKVVMTEKDFVHELQYFPPDLILSDYDLPQYNGALALAESKKRCPDAPFILVTGAVSEDRAIEILTQGAKDYVLKNRLRQRLVPAVRRALAEAEELRARKQAEAELREAHRTMEERVKIRTVELKAEIATRKKMEEALWESESRERARAAELQAFVDAVPGIVFIAHDPECSKMTGNRATNEFLRLQPQENVSKSAPDHEKPVTFRAMKNGVEVPPEELPVQQAAKGREVRNYELDIVFSDGVVRTILGNSNPVFDEHGNPRGAVAAFVEVTEHKQMEEALRQMTERLDMAQHAAKVGTWDWDVVTGHIEWSTQMFDLFGLNPLISTASFEMWKSVIFPKDIEIADRRIDQALREQTILNSDYRIVLPDGQIRWINAVGEGKYDDRGRPTRMIGICMDITERKQAEAALCESEQRLKFHFEYSPLAVVEWDTNFTVIQWSNEAKRIFGWEKGEVIGKRIDTLKMIHEDDIPIVNHTIERLTSGQERTVVSSNRNYTKSGAVIECTWHNSVLYNASGQMESVMSLIEDITERKRTEKQLFESNQRLQALLQAVPVGVSFSDDITCQRITGNPAVLQQFEVGPEDNLSASASDDRAAGRQLRFFHAGRQINENELPLQLAVAENRVIPPMELEVRLPSGRSWFTEASGAPVRDAQGNVIASLAVTVDITARKQVEAKLRRYELLAGRHRDVILFIGLDGGRILEANDAATRAYGYRYEQLLTLTIHDLLAVDMHGLTADQIAMAFDQGLLFEMVHRRQDGSTFPVEVSAQGAEIGGRRILISVVRDITERKRIEKELSERTAALEERTRQMEAINEELESFSYSVSHDLRAPLRAIDGYSRMILRQQGDKFDENTKRLFDVIRQNAKMMGQLIDDLLALSRLGREALSLSRLNVGDLTRDVWEELKAINPDRPVDLKICHIPPGMGDRSLIKQVLVNILSNAIKFTRLREAPLVEVGGYGAERENVYYVRDNGVGFDMQYHDKLFGVFQRLHSVDDYEGTGVGLAIVQRIIHRHGGRVWAESKVDEGACFHFTLPRG